MSGFNYTTTNLLADIKRRSFTPISQITFTNADLLNMADEEIQVGIVPFLMEAREEYLVTYKDYNIEGDTNEFEVPSRSIGAKLRDVTVLTSPSSQGNQPNEKSIPQINAEDSVWNNNYNNLLSIQSFFLRDNNVVLSPSASSYAGQQLRLYYFKRPNKLILPTECSQITSITDNTCTVNIVPTSYGSGQSLTITSDVVKAKPPFKLLTMDIDLIVDSTANTITFPDDLSSYDIEIGDYICLAGETPIPILPVELQSFLAQRVAVTLLSSMGDQRNFQMATNRLVEMEKNIRNLISNRVEGANRKVVNRFSTFNQSPYRR